MDEHREGLPKADMMRVEFSWYGPSGHGELERHSLEVAERTTVKALLADLPTVLKTRPRPDAMVARGKFVVINGAYLTPRDWGRQLQDGDAVVVVPIVAGG